MKNPPATADLIEKIREIALENIDREDGLPHDQPLMKVLGLDSLDMIEMSFCLEEFFGFEFSSKDVFDELNKAIGGGLTEEGKLTALGREMVLARAPELADVDLPEKLGVTELQQYYTLETFARLIREFYLAAPDTCPDSGEPVVLDGFKVVSETAREPVPVPSGDELMMAWVEKTAADLPQQQP